MVGNNAFFRFVDGKCFNFLGEYKAEIIGKISQERKLEGDRYELVE
jgi:hypothetical protein